MIRGSDGLDYENLTEKLLGNPANTYRNSWVKRLIAQGRSKGERQLWIDAFDHAFNQAQVQDLSAEFAAGAAADRTLSAHHIAQWATPTAQSRSRPG